MTRITKLLIYFLLIISVLFQNEQSFASDSKELFIPEESTIPILFKYPITSDQVKNNGLIKFAVADNVYVNEILLFRKDHEGIAHIKSFRNSMILGRGGRIEIKSGEVVDVYGNKHTLRFSEIIKGKNKNSAILLPLVVAGAAANVIIPAAAILTWGTGSLVPLVGASAVTAGASLTAFRKGEEAQLSSTKVIYAKHISPKSIRIKN